MLTRWNPFDEMNALFRDLDRLFRRSFSERAWTPTWEVITTPTLSPEGTERSGFPCTPAVEAYRKDNHLIFRAELPGIKPEEVEVSVVGNQLRLRGERKQSEEVKREDYYCSESSYGRFERAFTLPEGVKPEEVKALYSNGILEIQVPAKGLAEAHRIKIEGAPETKRLSKSAA